VTISRSARVFLERAEAFFRSADVLGVEPLDPSYGPAVGLLAVHSSISMTDAVLVEFDQGRSRAEDHNIAVTALEKLCSAKGLDKAGVRCLKDLIGQKTRFSYGDAVVRDEDFKRAKLRMEQFFIWAYRTFPGLPRTEEVPNE
jgi:hypothetical protein